MNDSPPPSKRRRYDAACRAEALRLVGENRSTRAAARVLNIDPKHLYKRQKEALAPVAAARGAELEPDRRRRTAPAASRQPAAGAGAGNFKKSHRQRLLHARVLADTGPMRRCRFSTATTLCGGSASLPIALINSFFNLVP